ncbi:hypothetical protein NW754_013791 [Fusarium falciforme]|nr:hypothetical protein NW754_013791 [Fusarium falciforme]
MSPRTPNPSVASAVVGSVRDQAPPIDAATATVAVLTLCVAFLTTSISKLGYGCLEGL